MTDEVKCVNGRIVAVGKKHANSMSSTDVAYAEESSYLSHCNVRIEFLIKQRKSASLRKPYLDCSGMQNVG